MVPDAFGADLSARRDIFAENKNVDLLVLNSGPLEESKYIRAFLLSDEPLAADDLSQMRVTTEAQFRNGSTDVPLGDRPFSDDLNATKVHDSYCWLRTSA